MVFCNSSSLPRSRPTRTTVPCLANSSAVKRPMPEVGPVMMYASSQVCKPVRGIRPGARPPPINCLSGQSFFVEKNQRKTRQRASNPALQCLSALVVWPQAFATVDLLRRSRVELAMLKACSALGRAVLWLNSSGSVATTTRNDAGMWSSFTSSTVIPGITRDHGAATGRPGSLTICSRSVLGPSATRTRP